MIPEEIIIEYLNELSNTMTIVYVVDKVEYSSVASTCHSSNWYDRKRYERSGNLWYIIR